MTPFVTITSAAVVLDRANVDTDQILPARFLRKPRSAGYQHFLFHDLRADPAFPLNDPRAEGAAILVAGPNFGSGSSREGAVYALVDAGFRCVIAPSFGDIFAGNAAKNGLLTLAAEQAAGLSGFPLLTVDLPAQRISLPGGATVAFAIDAFKKRCLLEGLDDIGLTLGYREQIAAFAARDQLARPWVPPA